MTSKTLLCLGALFASVCCTSVCKADITALTLTGSLANDASVFSYTFTNTNTDLLDFYTTSYGGGMNANGSIAPAGGFVPVLTLFSNATGNVLGFGGAGGICTGSMKADPTTGLCNDANFMATLGPGTYTLDLSEFPNVPTGNLSAPGFLAAGDTTFTGTNCGVTGGKFLEADLAPCVQRTANYDVNISAVAAATPEPPGWALLFLPAAVVPFLRRRQIA